MSKSGDGSSNDDHKSRGLKHIKNKKKYGRNRSDITQVATITKHKRHTALDSNWDRYDQEEEENDRALNASTDFSLLANTPISTGSHYVYKNQMDEDDGHKKTELFNIDFNVLEQSIATIPFNIRSDISDNNFTNVQKRIFESTAAENKVKYLSFLRSLAGNNIGNEELIPIFHRIEMAISEDLIENGVSQNGNKKTDVNELEDGMTQLKLSFQARGEIEPQNQDLEQWLDDVLDE